MHGINASSKAILVKGVNDDQWNRIKCPDPHLYGQLISCKGAKVI